MEGDCRTTSTRSAWRSTRRTAASTSASARANFTNAYLIDKDGKAALRPRRTSAARSSACRPDFKTREIVATGIRFPVGLAFNRHGDLFCTDQEGATWLPNGNPFDELLHIQKGRHYGFPPRHPKHLPDVIDEPSTFDYGPQHQSTCGLNFNEPVKRAARRSARRRGPATPSSPATRAASSTARSWCKTPAGYVARNHLLACLNMLTVDCCVSPDGDLVVACHSGGPDWGSGPTGKGKLYKIAYADRDHPQPVLAWPAGPREVRVEFDRPVDPELLRDVLAADEARPPASTSGPATASSRSGRATRSCRRRRRRRGSTCRCARRSSRPTAARWSWPPTRTPAAVTTR